MNVVMPDAVRARLLVSPMNAYCRDPKQFAGAYACSATEAGFVYVCDSCGDIDVEFHERKYKRGES